MYIPSSLITAPRFLILALVTSCKDYYMTIIFHIPNNCLQSLQIKQKSAARSSTCTKPTRQITAFFMQLEWLPVYHWTHLWILLLEEVVGGKVVGKGRKVRISCPLLVFLVYTPVNGQSKDVFSCAYG